MPVRKQAPIKPRKSIPLLDLSLAFFFLLLILGVYFLVMPSGG